MTETEKLKPCPHCQGVARLVRKTGQHGTAARSKWLREQVVCQTKKCGAMSAVFKRPGQALTAWNTRADAGEPAAWRFAQTLPGRSARTVWHIEQHPDSIAALRDAGVDLQPLYARPAPALDREGVARIVLEAMNSTVWGSPGFTSSALWPPRAEKAADAILALLSASTVEG
jgi:hypothetical protein